MERIGVRELRQNASRYLRKVESGETVEVSDRGRTVARLVPADGGSVRDRLVRDGRLRRRTGSWTELGEPLRPAGRPLPSRTLRRMRNEER